MNQLFYKIRLHERVRYTIPPDALMEMLKRLLELNHKIHEEEILAGLWNKKKPSAKFKTRKPNPGTAEEPESWYGQGKLF